MRPARHFWTTIHRAQPPCEPFTVRRVTVPDWVDAQDYDDGPDDDEWDEEQEEEE